MAVIRENIEIKGKPFVKNYSDLGFYIERDGIKYEDAKDPIEYANERYYTETDIPIEPVEEVSNEK